MVSGDETWIHYFETVRKIGKNKASWWTQWKAVAKRTISKTVLYCSLHMWWYSHTDSNAEGLKCYRSVLPTNKSNVQTNTNKMWASIVLWEKHANNIFSWDCKITAEDRYCVTTQKMQGTGNSCFNGDLFNRCIHVLELYLRCDPPPTKKRKSKKEKQKADWPHRSPEQQ